MKRALAIFAKTPLPGHVKTRLSPPLSPQEAADLYRCMLLDTIARVGSLGVDAYIFYDGDATFFRQLDLTMPLIPQTGSCLGSRLENAFSALGREGYDARVVIGSDAPDLPLPFIFEAFQQMEAGREVVFGPAEDGGYYLVGLSRDHCELFRDIPWSTADVLEASVTKAAAAGLVPVLLPTWYDVDEIEDLHRPILCDNLNGAPLTRAFIHSLGIAGSGADRRRQIGR